ncbi:MAG: sialate O-acetylesterase, partial [Myxococcota bacterium]
PDGHAPIPLHVSWRTTDHTWLEARVLDQKSGAPLPGFDFPDHRWKLEPAPEGQLGSFVLAAVPQGGNYDLHVRMVDAEGGAIRGEDTVHHIGIGDVFLTAGQSNMSGYPLAMNPAEIPSPMAHLFGNDFSWKKAIEPIDDGKRQFDLVSLDFPQHSPQLSFAKHLAESTGVPVAVIPSSNGRT